MGPQLVVRRVPLSRDCPYCWIVCVVLIFLTDLVCSCIVLLVLWL